MIFPVNFSVPTSGLWRSLPFLLILVAIKATAQPVLENIDVQKEQLASQRFHYQKAKLALAAGNMADYREHFDKLDDYPLKQYLEFTEIRRDLSALPFERIDLFLQTYPDTFLESRLRAYLLGTLAARKRWDDYLRYYLPTIASTSLQCHALLARHQSGDTSALTQVASLWNVGRSQPKACDPIFAVWRKAGYMREELIWSRFQKAMQNNAPGLARYLSTLMTELRPKAELFLKVHNQPHLVTNRTLFKDHDLPTQQIIVHGTKRLAYKQPLDALKHWELYEAQQLFPEHLSHDAKLHVVKRLIRGGHSHQAQHILSYSHSLRRQDVVEEIIREALASLDWHRVNDSIQLLEEDQRNSERWLYWRARAQDELDTKFDDFVPSTEIYHQLAENRSFYGFLSADKLHRTYALVDDSRPIDANLLQDVAAKNGIRRVHELWTIGNITEARYEWMHISRNLTSDELLAAGQLARDWGWYNTGINAMITGDLWNQLTVRFPLAYQEQITRLALDTQVEPTLIYAIARQESAFDERAQSPVGAMGLMQLMPKTAQYTAKMFGVKHNTKKDLLDAEHNMRLGSHYLKHLLGQFDGNRILAAAAYNAGPHRVNRWLSEAGKERPHDVWIETIPFYETRHYVQNVLCFSVIYGYRLGQPVSFVSELEARSAL